MTILVQSIEEKQSLFIIFEDPWDINDLKTSFDNDLAYREAWQEKYPNSKIHLIVDVSKASFHPKHIQEGRKSPSFTHPTKGLVIVVGANPLTRHLVGAVMGMLNMKRYYFVQSFDEALHIIEGQDTQHR